MKNERVRTYNRMIELGIKHYIVSACVIDLDGKKGCYNVYDLEKCHYTDESFYSEITRLERMGYNFFDVIHTHGKARIKYELQFKGN